jgi:hypothetical protein
MGASFRNIGQITALAGCDLLTISPELLAQLQASEAPLQRRLDPAGRRRLDLPAVHFDEPGFRYALNDDAMATEKLAEGIRAFARRFGQARRPDPGAVTMEHPRCDTTVAWAALQGHFEAHGRDLDLREAFAPRPRPLRSLQPAGARACSPTCRRTCGTWPPASC